LKENRPLEKKKREEYGGKKEESLCGCLGRR
jgi:hypothetical protein